MSEWRGVWTLRALRVLDGVRAARGGEARGHRRRLDVHARGDRRDRAAARPAAGRRAVRCTTRTSSGSRIVSGLARRMLDRAGAPDAPDDDDEPRRSGRGRGRRADPDPRRRPGGAHGRRVGAARVRLHRPGDDRLRRAREGAPHGAGRARDRRARARAIAPDAWIVDFTNPVGIVTKALLDAGHRAVGLCSAAMVFQRHFAKVLDVAPERIELDHARAQPPDVGGRRAARRRRRPAGAARRRARRPRRAARPACRPTLVQRLGIVPSYYLHYFYEHDAVVEDERREQVARRGGRPRSSASCCTCTPTRRSTRSRSC